MGYQAAVQKFKEAEVLEGLRNQSLGDAAKLCDDLLSENPANADALHLAGIVAFKQNKFETALDRLRLAVALENQRLDLHFALGNALLMLGRNDEAVKHYETTALCLPDQALPHKWLSDLHKIAKRMTEASFHYGKWIELNPEARAQNVKESTKARARREKAGFFAKYCQGQGIDIGWGGDLVAPNCRPWDFEDGDAELMAGVADETYDFVYSSHNLEHLHDVDRALLNWWRILKKGGYLILFLPDRDLFEKRKTLPSAVHDHRHYFMAEQDDPPDTIGVRPMIQRLLPDAEIISIEVCGELNEIGQEYSIEAIVRKSA